MGENLADKIEPLLKKSSHKELQLLIDRFGSREHLTGIAVYNAKGEALVMTPGLAPRFPKEPELVDQTAKSDQSAGQFQHLGEAPVYISASLCTKMMW